MVAHKISTRYKTHLVKMYGLHSKGFSRCWILNKIQIKTVSGTLQCGNITFMVSNVKGDAVCRIAENAFLKQVSTPTYTWQQRSESPTQLIRGCQKRVCVPPTPASIMSARRDETYHSVPQTEVRRSAPMRKEALKSSETSPTTHWFQTTCLCIQHF
jgi:hypothetical protein